LPTVFAVGVDEAQWTATSIEIFVGVASTAMKTRLTSTRMIAVAHVDAGQRLLEQLHRALVDHHLHTQLSVVTMATSSSSSSSSRHYSVTPRLLHPNVGKTLYCVNDNDSDETK